MTGHREINFEELFAEAIDLVLPILPPYEFSLYLLLLRRSFIEGGTLRIGKRTISQLLGKTSRSGGGSFNHITEKLRNLEVAGFIKVGLSNRLGTEIAVSLPKDVPAIQLLLDSSRMAKPLESDYFNDSSLRKVVFDRDNWRCHYCGDPLTEKTASLDHIIPASKNGPNTLENLTAACLTCNSIKAGRTYDEAAPEILARVVSRKATDSN